MRKRRPKSLAQIVRYLRDNWPNIESVYEYAIQDLTALSNLHMRDDADNPGYEYDGNKFKSLYKTKYGKYDPTIRNRPDSLAEALLWKLGKWDAYISFVDDYTAPSERELNDDEAIVFYAFARHLRNGDLPIFDQHAARAIWVISKDTWGVSQKVKWSEYAKEYGGWSGDLYFHFLMRQSGSWKTSGDGDTALACLNSFYDEVEEICLKSRLTADELDKLLMPLGQAIKDYTSIHTRSRRKIEQITAAYSLLQALVSDRNHTLEDLKNRRKCALAERKRLVRENAKE